MIVCPWKDLKRYEAVIPGLEEAMKAVEALENFEPATYPLSGSNKILVQKVITKAWEKRDQKVWDRYFGLGAGGMVTKCPTNKDFILTLAACIAAECRGAAACYRKIG